MQNPRMFGVFAFANDLWAVQTVNRTMAQVLRGSGLQYFAKLRQIRQVQIQSLVASGNGSQSVRPGEPADGTPAPESTC